MGWVYDSGGKHQNHDKYKEGYERIFGKKCPICGLTGGKHKMDCGNSDDDRANLSGK